MIKKILFITLLATALNAQSISKDFARFNLNNGTIEAGCNPHHFNITQTISKKKAGLAVVYSLLLPGMGELYAGSYSSGKYFTIADGLLWGTLLGLNIYGNWERDNYKNFARTYGGVNPNGKDATYFANIGIYNSIKDYNREKNLNREFSRVYDETEFYWRWKTDQQRREYRGMWKSSEYAFNSIQFAVGALIINRIISAINAARLVARRNKNIKTAVNWNLKLNVARTPDNSPYYKLDLFTEF